MIDGLSPHGRAFADRAAAVGARAGGGRHLHLHRAWNELLLALVLITSDSQRTAPLALNYLITSDVLPWGPLMAGAVLSSVPLMILYFIAQRFMVQGMTAGSVKG